jgi:hypothetical protein
MQPNPKPMNLAVPHHIANRYLCEKTLYSLGISRLVNTVIHSKGARSSMSKAIPSFLPLTGVGSCLLLDVFRRLLQAVVALLVCPSGSEAETGEGGPCSPLEQED